MILLKFFLLYTAGLELMCLNPGIPFPHRLTLVLKETLFFISLTQNKIWTRTPVLCRFCQDVVVCVIFYQLLALSSRTRFSRQMNYREALFLLWGRGSSFIQLVNDSQYHAYRKTYNVECIRKWVTWPQKDSSLASCAHFPD